MWFWSPSHFGGHHTLARYALFLGTTCINPSILLHTESTIVTHDITRHHRLGGSSVPLVMFWRIRDTILFALRFKHHIQFFLLSTNKLINSPPLDPHPRHPLSISSTSSNVELLCRCCAEIILINLLIFPGREYSEFFAQSSVTPISLTCAYLNVSLVFSGCLGMLAYIHGLVEQRKESNAPNHINGMN